MTPVLLAYGSYGHHYGGGATGYLSDIAIRGVLYSVISRVMRSVSLAEALMTAVAAVCLFLVFSRR